MSTWAPLRGLTRADHRREAPEVDSYQATAPPPSASVGAAWLAMCPRGATVLRDPDASVLRCVPAGTRLVLVTDRAWGRLRLRRTARRAGLVVEREVLLLPGTGRTIVSIDEDSEAVRHFWTSIAMVPPGVTWPSLALTGALRLAGSLPWRWTGLVAGGHLLIGSQP